MVENSFKGYIDFFIFYIILINYAIFMDQILIFDPCLKENYLNFVFFCQ